MTPRDAYKKVCDMKPFVRDAELEVAIATHADYSHRYAFHFLKAAFPEGEAVMQTDPLVWDWYQVDTLKTKASVDLSLV